MIKLTRTALSFIAVLFLSLKGNAQQAIKDPAIWFFESQKGTSKNDYKFIFHVQLLHGWHLFSQQPGDSSLLPPVFQFDGAPEVVVDSPILEHGQLTTKLMEGVDSPVHYYEGRVDFIASVHFKSKQKPKSVTGTYEFQLCNDRMCLPPKKNRFTFDVPE